MLAKAYEDTGKYAEASALFREVLLIAGEVHDDGQFASALLGLMEQSGRIPGRLSEVIALAPVARGVIARLGNPPQRLSDLELQIATAYSRAGKNEEALAHADAAIKHAEKNPDDKLQLGSIHTNYAATLEAQGRYPEARAKALRALELIEQVLGKEH